MVATPKLGDRCDTSCVCRDRRSIKAIVKPYNAPGPPSNPSHASPREGSSALAQDHYAPFSGNIALHQVLLQKSSAINDTVHDPGGGKFVSECCLEVQAMTQPTLYIRLARKHSTSSMSSLVFASVLFPNLTAAANSVTGMRVRRRAAAPSFDSSNPPAK